MGNYIVPIIVIKVIIKKEQIMSRDKLIKSEVVHLFNTTKETLRHYEQKGILKPEITEKKYRYYDFEDIKKLRQIFLFRDLELSVEEMKQLDSGQVKKDEYIELLNLHQNKLKQKIQKLNNIELNINQLVELLINGENRRSYQIRLEKERYYYVLETLPGDEKISAKAFYDQYESIIQSNYYSERTLQMIYPFAALESGELIDSQLSIELTDSNVDQSLNMSTDNIITLPKGAYLSIFYPFNEEEFSDLPELKDAIEVYLKKEGLARIGSLVLEKEHPELSIFLDEGTTIYELQIPVISKKVI